MTTRHDFKQAVRNRMLKTGERYTTARAVLLQSGSAGAISVEPLAGLFPGYASLGGICRDTGSLRNVLAASGLIASHTNAPLTEAMVSGLCGGIGFLYAVFEYKGWPPILSILGRYDTMPDAYITGGLARLGVQTSVSETTSAKVARKALDEAIDAKQPALCVVDCVGLRRDDELEPTQMAGVAPTVVAVAGVDGDDLLIDDGGAAPRRMSHEQFARARALYKKGKHRLVTIQSKPGAMDLANQAKEAIAATAHRYRNSPYKGFASNFGFAGLEKWRHLLTDARDKKGWPTVFPEGHLAYLALRRTYDGIEHEFTPPAAGRLQYAEFLRETAEMTGDGGLRAAADLYERAGGRWSALAGIIASCGDPAVEEGCKLGDSAREIFDEVDCPRRAEVTTLVKKRISLAKQCAMTRPQALSLYEKLAEHVDEIIALESQAVTKLESLTSSHS